MLKWDSNYRAKCELAIRKQQNTIRQHCQVNSRDCLHSFTNLTPEHVLQRNSLRLVTKYTRSEKGRKAYMINTEMSDKSKPTYTVPVALLASIIKTSSKSNQQIQPKQTVNGKLIMFINNVLPEHNCWHLLFVSKWFSDPSHRIRTLHARLPSFYSRNLEHAQLFFTW